MLEFSVDIEPDDQHMVDGLALATQLVDQAIRLINPYVKECPACLDTVFSHIANGELTKIHAAMAAGGKARREAGTVICLTDAADRDEIIRDHLEKAQDLIAAIVARSADGPCH